jgi:hypothetical protein
LSPHNRASLPARTVAARALLQALDTGWQPDSSAAALTQAAGGCRPVIECALAQIQLRSTDRTSPVARRATEALRLSLLQIPS